MTTTWRLSPSHFLGQTFASKLDAQHQAIRYLLSLGYKPEQIEHDESFEDFCRVTAGFQAVLVISSAWDDWHKDLQSSNAA